MCVNVGRLNKALRHGQWQDRIHGLCRQRHLACLPCDAPALCDKSDIGERRKRKNEFFKSEQSNLHARSSTQSLDFTPKTHVDLCEGPQSSMTRVPPRSRPSIYADSARSFLQPFSAINRGTEMIIIAELEFHKHLHFLMFAF